MLRRAGSAALFAIFFVSSCSFVGGGDGDGDDVDAGDDTPRFPSGHLFRKSITVAPQGETELGGFMLAVFTPEDAQIAAAAADDASDFLLTVADSSEALPFEIESYDPETGAFSLWVQRNLKDEVLHLYYGLDSAAERPVFEWPLDFRGVWHGRVSGNLALDSSRNRLDAERTDAGVPPTITEGVVGVGLELVGTSAQFETSGEAIIFARDSFTYSAWVMVTDTGGTSDQPWHFGGSDRNVPGYDMELGSGPWRAHVAGGGELNQADFGALGDFAGEWTQIVAIVDRTNNVLVTYANGTRRDQTPIAPDVDLSPGSAMVASIGGDQSPFIGTLDEVRVNGSVLGEARIREQYANLTAPGYITVGGEETPE